MVFISLCRDQRKANGATDVFAKLLARLISTRFIEEDRVFHGVFSPPAQPQRLDVFCLGLKGAIPDGLAIFIGNPRLRDRFGLRLTLPHHWNWQ